MKRTHEAGINFVAIEYFVVRTLAVSPCRDLLRSLMPVT
jgi:hypothetical protein